MGMFGELTMMFYNLHRPVFILNYIYDLTQVTVLSKDKSMFYGGYYFGRPNKLLAGNVSPINY